VSVARALRILAFAIAVAGLADPVMTRERPVPQPLAIVLLDPATADASALTAAERLRGHLAADYDTSVRLHDRAPNASPCPAEGACVVVSAGALSSPLTSGAAVVGAVRVPTTRDRGVVITDLAGPKTVNLHGAATLHVSVSRNGDPGSLETRVFDGDVLVGRVESAEPEDRTASVTDGVSRGTIVIPVEWTPIAAGPRRLRVQVERGAAAASAEVGVDVDIDPTPVLMYEPQATWLGTFVRRAISEDPRFQLDARTRLAPQISVGAGRGTLLTKDALSNTTAIIVSAPESLTAAEVDLLEQYVATRGGSLVLLPDRRPSGPIARLLPAITSERRNTDPRSVGLLRAAEFLVFDGSAEGVTVLDKLDDQPVVISRALGRGRIILSGALDAWRFRDATGQFARFWASLVAAAADSAGQSLQVTLDEALIAPGELTNVTVEWRRMDTMPPAITAAAHVRCDDGYVSPIRLWPDARRGTFHGLVHAMTPSRCVVQAAITSPSDVVGSAALHIADEPQHAAGNTDSLESAIMAHGGVVVDAGAEAALASHVRERLPTERKPQETRPMRSAGWIIPFAACLGAEWWLRRRQGLR
jgi:hypothetical protein